MLRVLPRRRRDQVVAAVVVLLLAAGLGVWFAVRAPAGYRVENRVITVRTGPHRDRPVPLDTTLYVPDTTPAPAVLLAHGFGGTKASVASDAKDLAGRGYVVLTWTAEGFGRSGGQIHLNSPDWEVTDASRLVDWLGHRPEVRRDGADDPRVAAVGGSYGGALALLLAAQDRRVDAIVPQITWNDLGRALFPESSGAPATDGVLKRAWLGALFADGLGGSGTAARAVPGCGRFAADVCAMYRQVAASGRATPAALALLRRSSPAPVLSRIHAPTLLVQGLADTLFPLSEADANARGITHAPVQVAWFSGGHDGGTGSAADHDRVRFLTAQWLDHYLRGGAAPADAFTYSRIIGYDRYDATVRTTAFSVRGGYPGLTAAGTTVPLSGPPQRIANPPDGTPAAVSTLPGAGFAGVSPATEVPGQAAGFQSGTLDRPVDLSGAPRVRVTAPVGAVLFAKLYDVGPDGRQTLVGGQAAPFRVARAGPTTVTLPGMVYRFQSGHRIRLVVDTADQAYAGPREPATYTVAVVSGLTVPAVAGTPLTDPAGIWYWVLLVATVVVVLAVVAALLTARVRRRRRQRAVVAEHADTPLVVAGLRKTYKDGFVAVRGTDFTVHRGQVVGLLGPNGAGKTTSLRMLLGLIRPTAGEILVFGHRVTAGAPVLSRIGSLVEGPGFLPHLTGLDNLRLYWRATGRPADTAGLDEVLDIADLGDAVHRPVRTYSHGMKQRLAIAQAMLGLPELLVLDEPTDGLDPPQIAEMRRVLQRYATDGRSVLVSSHLLAEVEQTCTHVVVMRRGELVASGPVADIIGDSPSVLVSVSDVDTAEPLLRKLSGISSVARADGGFVVELADLPRRDLVSALVSAGVGVDRVVPRRRLEDAFLALLERGES
ncbi:alpha/beta fold hydrolase [Actinocatenispora rupis]|uniref:ABC transporter ATP-binding protein n=1 Tax=Actinocatenispora rupis TaxID=519421 RepID=A0A8J3NBV1_9ACTN|nr:alpha/beta fold hydrolase [Actinocatenispora rupis]GID13729.1 ABC transporter ATP-binding protein [Actinocatenispora rupis]